jgi:hypothetical protein
MSSGLATLTGEHRLGAVERRLDAVEGKVIRHSPCVEDAGDGLAGLAVAAIILDQRLARLAEGIDHSADLGRGQTIVEIGNRRDGYGVVEVGHGCPRDCVDAI